MSTWAIIAGAIIGFASLVSAITVIYRASQGTVKKLDDRTKILIRDEVKPIMDEREEQRAELQRIKDEAILNELKSLRADLQEERTIQKGLNTMISKALVETWKEDFRQIYYELRETGIISCSDKAYLDKIYHYYKDLGGNSDIDAKYKEICLVHSKRTQEQHDKAWARYREEQDN